MKNISLFSIFVCALNLLRYLKLTPWGKQLANDYATHCLSKKNSSKLLSLCMCVQMCIWLWVCVCVAGHQTVECIQIIRWWSSNLRKVPLRSLGSFANCYLLVYFNRHSHSSHPLIYFKGGGTPLLPWHPHHRCVSAQDHDYEYVCACVYVYQTGIYKLTLTNISQYEYPISIPAKHPPYDPNPPSPLHIQLFKLPASPFFMPMLRLLA